MGGGELRERAMAAQVQQVKGGISKRSSTLELAVRAGTGEQLQQVEHRMVAGLAVQVQRAEESMPEIKLQRLWAEGELREQTTVLSAGGGADGGSRGDLKELMTGAQLQQMEERMGKISVEVRDLGVWKCWMMPLTDLERFFVDMQQVSGRMGLSNGGTISCHDGMAP